MPRKITVSARIIFFHSFQDILERKTWFPAGANSILEEKSPFMHNYKKDQIQDNKIFNIRAVWL